MNLLHTWNKEPQVIEYSKLDQATNTNWYETDPNLQFLLRRYLAPEDFEWAEPRLRHFGEICGGPVAERAEISDKNPPRLIRYDRHGDEINLIKHEPGAISTRREIHQHYLSLDFSERGRGKAGRVPSTVNTAFSYLLSQAETGMLCAVGMTSGAASLIESHGGPAAKDHLLGHMVSESFEDFWDGAMFMTETAGGSDVGATETTARHVEGEIWSLNGFKWFCSNVDADVIVTLARPEGAPEGSRGLALFAIPKIKRNGEPNGLHIHRLKDKLGTRVVPTGEVELVDAEAYLLANGSGADSRDPANATDGRGLIRMMSMVNGSRHGVAAMGLGIARRCFLEAAIYASRRRAFGTTINNFPLIRESLVRMLMETEGCAAMVFDAANALDTEDRILWRILVPLSKYRAARRGFQIASASLEILGGNGYIEDWPTARQLRDAQCHTIWEGAENIICLDVRRAAAVESAHKVLLDRLDEALSTPGSKHKVLKSAEQTLRRAMTDARRATEIVMSAPKDLEQLHTRRLARCLADVAQGALLFEEAAWELEHTGSGRKAALTRLFSSVRLRERSLWGIESQDRTVIDLFDKIIGYDYIDPEQVIAASDEAII